MVKLGRKHEKTRIDYKSEAKYYLESNSYDYQAACQNYLEDLKSEEDQYISEKTKK